jgi:hypothetical protein
VSLFSRQKMYQLCNNWPMIKWWKLWRHIVFSVQISKLQQKTKNTQWIRGILLQSFKLQHLWNISGSY